VEETAANGGVTPATRRRRGRLTELGRHLVKRDKGGLANATVWVALAVKDRRQTDDEDWWRASSELREKGVLVVLFDKAGVG